MGTNFVKVNAAFPLAAEIGKVSKILPSESCNAKPEPTSPLTWSAHCERSTQLTITVFTTLSAAVPFPPLITVQIWFGFLVVVHSDRVSVRRTCHWGLEREGPVRGDSQRVAAIILQDDARTRVEPGDLAADRGGDI